MRILFIGDIFGKQGRKALADFLPKIIKKNNIDFVYDKNMVKLSSLYGSISMDANEFRRIIG